MAMFCLYCRYEIRGMLNPSNDRICQFYSFGFFLLQTATFTVNSGGKTCSLTLDWNVGFTLNDPESKQTVWQYKFSQLRGSSDDAKSKMKLHFQDNDIKAIETKVRST